MSWRLDVLDMRIDQEYLRSQPVNSEEGAPMGIGIWYEMFIATRGPSCSRTDPRGSLRYQRQQFHGALPQQLEARRPTAEPRRDEPDGARRGFFRSTSGDRVGSADIRKVHFRDSQMIKQIEEKVVNRLRQVTSAIKQDGANQVSIITSTAERQAAVEFAKAAAIFIILEFARDQEMFTEPQRGPLFERTVIIQNRIANSRGRDTDLPKLSHKKSIVIASVSTSPSGIFPLNVMGKLSALYSSANAVSLSDTS